MNEQLNEKYSGIRPPVFPYLVEEKGFRGTFIDMNYEWNLKYILDLT